MGGPSESSRPYRSRTCDTLIKSLSIGILNSVIEAKSLLTGFWTKPHFEAKMLIRVNRLSTVYERFMSVFPVMN